MRARQNGDYEVPYHMSKLPTHTFKLNKSLNYSIYMNKRLCYYVFIKNCHVLVQ